jgi:hypothetical protein
MHFYSLFSDNYATFRKFFTPLKQYVSKQYQPHTSGQASFSMDLSQKQKMAKAHPEQDHSAYDCSIAYKNRRVKKKDEEGMKDV